MSGRSSQSMAGVAGSLVRWLSLALAWLPLASLPADEIRLSDGRSLSGQILGVVAADGEGRVHALTREEVVFAATSASAAAPAATWGTRGGAAPGTPAQLERPAFPPGSVALSIRLEHESASVDPRSPEAATEKDPGPVAEVFAYRHEQAKTPGTWIRLGNAPRIRDERVTNFDDQAELEMVRGLLRDPAQTRETILAAIEQARTWRRRMEYRFDGHGQLAPGTWSIHVSMPGLRRHRIWHGVRMAPDAPAELEYRWTSHWSFGQ